MSKTIIIESLAVEPPVEILRTSSNLITIGREPENNVVVDSAAVSRRHASIFSVDGHWLMKDFESSNGTWVNGAKVTPGGIKLLRHGDVIKLADFVLRFAEENPQPENEWRAAPCSLLVFYRAQYEGEYPLVTEGSRFQIGGPEGDYFIEGADPESIFLKISLARGSLEVTVPNVKEKVSVNGMLVSGIVSVTDRDELEVPPYNIVINNPQAALTAQEARIETPAPAKVIHAYEQDFEVAQPDDADGWISEAARRKASLGQRYLFGSDDDSGMERTMSVPTVKPEQFRTSTATGSSRTGYEMSASQKFSATYMDESEGKGFGENLLVVFGVVIFILLVVFVVYLVATFT